jgi:hypothetical protein
MTAESVAGTRRDSELNKLGAKKASVDRDLSMPFGAAGQARPAAITAQLQQQADEIAAEIARLHDLKGSELVKRYAPEIAA